MASRSLSLRPSNADVADLADAFVIAGCRGGWWSSVVSIEPRAEGLVEPVRSFEVADMTDVGEHDKR